MASNLTNQFRNVLSKKFMVKKEVFIIIIIIKDNIYNINLVFGILNVLEFECI